MASLLDYLRRQGNITRDHEIAYPKPIDYFIVSDIETRCHLKKINAARRWYAYRLIGDKRQLHPGALRRPE